MTLLAILSMPYVENWHMLNATPLYYYNNDEQHKKLLNLEQQKLNIKHVAHFDISSSEFLFQYTPNKGESISFKFNK